MSATELIAALGLALGIADGQVTDGPFAGRTISNLAIAAIAALTLALGAALCYALRLRARLMRRTRALESEIARRHEMQLELAEIRTQLEQQVQERTSALQAQNDELLRARLALAAANERLRRLVAIDALTGIANRRHFDRALDRELRRARRDGRPLSLVFLDLDEFKHYNDTYGHARGDEALRRVAQALDETFRRGGDLVARYGGEEFAVILPGVDARRAGLYAERLRRRIWRLAIGYGTSSVSDRVTISGGVATLMPPATCTPQELLQAADRALYSAKRLGRNRIASALIASASASASEKPSALGIAS